MKLCFLIIMPIAIIIATIYGMINPLKAKGTLGFNIKYFYKTEESTIFVRRTYAILLFIFNIFYSIYSILILFNQITFYKLLTILLLILSVLIPGIITIIIYLFIFDKEGKRK